MRRLPVLLGCVFVCEWANAGAVLDYLRDYDLNDYALGIAVAGEQNPYAGAKNGSFAYPFLSSFRDAAFTNDWFLIRDGDLGARWISESGWELAAVVRVQTLGLGNNDSDALLGIADRKWTLEAGPAIGWRGWPIHFNFKTYAEISNRHDGLVSQLAISVPMEGSRGYFVPSVETTYQDSAYTDYYYEVTAAEATVLRPAYRGGAATNLALKARWGYALNDHWLLSGSVGLEYLDSAITDSPIVERDEIWSVRIGLAYNADVFQPRHYDDSAPRTPRFDLRVGGFRDSISTKVVRDTSNGVAGVETDIENFLGVPDEKTVLEAEATVRLGHYHRLEFGYLELGRNSSTTLVSDFTFGDAMFPAGAIVDTRVEARIFRAGYSYSLIRDAQKELAVMAGVHLASFEVDISRNQTGQAETSRAGTPLPVIGAQASVFLGQKTTIGAKVQIFRTDFDRYEGSLNYGSVDIQHRVADAISVGLGYRLYGMKLSSSETGVNGYLKVRHHGPVAFVTIGF
jgi:outer membrane protein